LVETDLVFIAQTINNTHVFSHRQTVTTNTTTYWSTNKATNSIAIGTTFETTI